MRKPLALMLLLSPWSLTQAAIEVSPNAIMRLPAVGNVLHVDRLEVADNGTLLVPAKVKDIQIEHLSLGRQARLAIAPDASPVRVEVGAAVFADGAMITARGAQGTYAAPATAGRDLTLRFKTEPEGHLLIDARGGKGAPGYHGLAGADGKPGGCTWGQATEGHDGHDGGDGQSGARGANVRLELPQGFEVERLQVRVEGGAGGEPGKAGDAGRGGNSKGCLVYSTDAGRSGKPGKNGQPGVSGPEGKVEVVQF